MILVLALVALIVATVLCALGSRYPTLPWGCAAGFLGLALTVLVQVPGLR